MEAEGHIPVMSHELMNTLEQRENEMNKDREDRGTIKMGPVEYSKRGTGE